MVVLIARVLLALVFMAAAVGKLLDLAGSRQAVADFGVPERAAPLIGTLLPFAELAVAAGLNVRPISVPAAALGLALLLGFIAGIARVMREGLAPDCHCFGALHSEPAGPSTLVRNGVLAAGAVLVLAAGPGRSFAHLAGHQVALLAVSMVAGAAVAVAVALWGETRRLRTAALPDDAGHGLPVGSFAPDLLLETSSGETLGLRSRLATDRHTLLLQVSPGCGACQALMPSLARWRTALADRLEILVISSSDAEGAAKLEAEHPGTEYLAASGTYSAVYRVRPTPSAVLLDLAGRIASPPALGGISIEALIRNVPAPVDASKPGLVVTQAGSAR